VSTLAPPFAPVTPELLERLTTTLLQRFPRKSFGYLLSTPDQPLACDFALFEDNVRNSPEWRERFESYGQYFVEHEDAGFVATPEESWRVQQEIWAKAATQVGVFHSHLRHPANFSGIDYDMHTQRFDDLWHMIISMRNPEFVQIRTYAVSRNGVREMLHGWPAPDAAEEARFPLDLKPGKGAGGAAAKDAAASAARAHLKLAPDGSPECKDNKAICACIGQLLQTGGIGLIDEFLTWGFLKGSAKRYHDLIEPGMHVLAGQRFDMGSNGHAHFCGEAPCHEVNISSFAISEVPVTQGLYHVFDSSRPVHALNKPVVDVTWFDALVFSMWMGCRLPSEAEWEFACGAGKQDEWACGPSSDLPRHAWYSENAQGMTREVRSLAPNAFGLYDLHGNVWEWCFDCYDEHYYSRAPSADPVCLASPFARRCCRGGSVHALAEMCRTRYRWSEPPDFAAGDLGIRLARSTFI
jgi:formylglycine-generating enzyme required for sulfatase activity/proteasome lid subunit RPN8/RPN11